MGISPWQVGQLLPLWQDTITGDNGAAIPLTGGTVTGILHNTVTGQDTPLTGTFLITNAALGQVQYTWSAADVAVAGNYVIVRTVTFSGGALKIDPVPFLILAY